MSELNLTPGSPEPQNPPEETLPRKRSRLRRFFLRHLPLSLAAMTVLLILVLVGLYFVASSSSFENVVRKRLVTHIETLTGGRVEIQSFHWRLLHLEAEADGLTIHGLEDPGDAPYAQIEHLRVQLSLLGFFTPRILVHDLELVRPRLHWIVYPDGSTNQPRPLKKKEKSKSGIDTLFDFEAGRIAIDDGLLNYDERADSLDFQERYLPLDFQASDASLAVRYIPPSYGAPEHYRIETGLEDLHLNRAVPHAKYQTAHGILQATIDLERNRLSLSSLRFTSRIRGEKDRTLQISGVLDDFNHPRWQAKAAGDVDLRLIDPIFGFPRTPEGIADLDLTAEGKAAAYRIQGRVRTENTSYISDEVVARGVDLDAQLQIDPDRLFIPHAIARLRAGGQLEGSIDLHPWLPPDVAPPAQISAAGPEASRSSRNTIVRAPFVPTPMNGKVEAMLTSVTLDTILDMVAGPDFRHLGFAALVTGPATATWSGGEDRSIVIGANLSLVQSPNVPAGEVPASGIIDGTYAHRSGSVDLRRLELHLPASDLIAHGALGAHPVTSASSLTVDFRSHNLSEFDTVFRRLGAERNGKSGAAALPIALAGQAEFHGSWTGSLEYPHLTGALKATQIALEMPGSVDASGQPQLVNFDSIDALGSYSPTQISVDHAELVHGPARVALHGTMDATPGPEPVYDSNSVVHARFEAASLNIAEVQPLFTTSDLPVKGILHARIQADGPLRSPTATGSIEMEQGTIYDEPVSQLRLDGTLVDHLLKLTTATLHIAGGTLSAPSSYDLQKKTLQLDAHGTGIDLSRIGWIHRHNLDTTGKLDLSLKGAGAWDDPQIDARASIASLTLGGQQFGTFQATANARNHALAYHVTTQLDSAELNLQGQTVLSGNYATSAHLDFSRFNLGSVLRMARIDAFTADSALAGSISIDGPLQDMHQLRGEVRLPQFAAAIAGVHLHSENGAHATLSDGRLHLDPVHIVGDDTDMHAEGTLALQGDQQLDFASSGTVNLKLAETLDPDLTAGGVSTFQVEAHGSLQHPDLKGRVDFQNGSLSLEDLPNGLSQLHGTLVFNQNRLEVKSLTAMSGGGLLSVGGYLSYQHGIFADLTATGKEVHVRYPQGVSSLADARMQLQGPQNNLLLSGDVLITHFAASPDLDLASLAAQASSSVPAIVPPGAPSNHVRLDVHIISTPQLSFQNAFAKLAGNVDLHLRGTLASPSLLGRVSITEGSALIAGTRYELERGEITFTNPLRIEPAIDLSATAHVEDYDISLGLHGSPRKLAVTYRSDPPLPEADVVSLLALGHTANQQRLYTQQQEQAIANPTTDALLGGALNATVSSRVQKLFGAGSVKVDPNYLGAFGNSTSRITVEEQLGRVVTLTYATDVNTTSQQLLQADVAINRHVSVVLTRDESGVFSMIVKNTRRFR